MGKSRHKWKKTTPPLLKTGRSLGKATLDMRNNPPHHSSKNNQKVVRISPPGKTSLPEGDASDPNWVHQNYETNYNRVYLHESQGVEMEDVEDMEEHVESPEKS